MPIYRHVTIDPVGIYTGSLYGFDKFVEWTENMQNEKDVSKVLIRTYGFSADYFYEKLAPYVWAHIPS